MKTTIVPAQITSVEDRIAGNFTFTQIFLLIIALLSEAGLYLILPPHLNLGAMKTTLMVMTFLVIGGLTIRIQGKIIAQWLVIYLQFYARPRVYVFTKNDLATRSVDKYEPEVAVASQTEPAQSIVTRPALTIMEQMRINKLIDDPSLTVSFELSSKGGINVSLAPVKK
jgi:hypothetical protein